MSDIQYTTIQKFEEQYDFLQIKRILLIGNDALNWSKLTAKTFMVSKIYLFYIE